MSIFDEVKQSAEGRELSVNWYRTKISSLGGDSKDPIEHINEGRSTIRHGYGIMNLFHYLPKTAEKLPFYDVFPLVIPIESKKGGFLGINFHYLTIPQRVRILSMLTDAFGDEEKLNFTWMSVSSNSKIRPIVRRYKTQNINSRVLRISLEDMLIAVLLPVQRFYKGPIYSRTAVSSNVVYSNIRKQM